MDAEQTTIVTPLPKRRRSVRPDPALKVDPLTPDELQKAREALDVLLAAD
jgi:hypothetical protein